MNYTLDEQTRTAAAVRRLFAVALMLWTAHSAGLLTRMRNSSTPDHSCPHHATGGKLSFPAGPRHRHARLCTPHEHRRVRTVNGARPEATLFTSLFGQDIQIITHFLSPDTNPNEFAPNPLPFGSATWQSSFDTSKVWAQAVHSISAGSDASCPNTGAIGCLLLQSIGSQQGPTGGTA